MTENIITTKRRALWVYGLPLPRDAALDAIAEPLDKWDENDDPVLWPLAVALGVDYLDHDFVEPAFVEDMNKPVSTYVQETTRASDDVFADARAALDAQTGAIIMISQDIGEEYLSRTPDAPFVFLGVFPLESYSFSLGPTAPASPSRVASAAASSDRQHTRSTPPMNPSRRNTLIVAVLVGIACIVMGIRQML